MDQSATTQFQYQTGIAFAVVWLIQKAKKAGFLKFINDDTTKFNRLLSALAATAVTAGITIHYDPTGGVLTMAGLTLANALGFVSTLLSQGAIQEVLYQVGFKAPKTAIALAETALPPAGAPKS
jgi:hypothetical protein